MKIDKSKLKIGKWYEDENGNRIESMDKSPEPVTKVGAKTYHSCFPLEITEHERKYLKKDTGLIRRLRIRRSISRIFKCL